MIEPTRALAVVPGPGRCPFCEAPQALPVRVTLTSPERAWRRRALAAVTGGGLAVAALSAAGVTTGLLLVGRALAWIVGFTALPVGLYIRATADQEDARLDAALSRSQGLGQRLKRGLADLLTWGEVSRQEQAAELRAREQIARERRLGTTLAAVGALGLAAVPVLGAFLAAGSMFLIGLGVATAAGAGGAYLALTDRPHCCPDCTQTWLDRTQPLRRLLAGRISRIVALVEAHRTDEAVRLAGATVPLVQARDAGLPTDLHARWLALEACLTVAAGEVPRGRTGLETARRLARDTRLSARLDELVRDFKPLGQGPTSDLESEAIWLAAALEFCEQVESQVLETPGPGLDRAVDTLCLLPATLSLDPGGPDDEPREPGRSPRPRA